MCRRPTVPIGIGAGWRGWHRRTACGRSQPGRTRRRRHRRSRTIHGLRDSPVLPRHAFHRHASKQTNKQANRKQTKPGSRRGTKPGMLAVRGSAAGGSSSFSELVALRCARLFVCLLGCVRVCVCVRVSCGLACRVRLLLGCSGCAPPARRRRPTAAASSGSSRPSCDQPMRAARIRACARRVCSWTGCDLSAWGLAVRIFVGAGLRENPVEWLRV